MSGLSDFVTTTPLPGFGKGPLAIHRGSRFLHCDLGALQKTNKLRSVRCTIRRWLHSDTFPRLYSSPLLGYCI